MNSFLGLAKADDIQSTISDLVDRIRIAEVAHNSDVRELTKRIDDLELIIKELKSEKKKKNRR